VKPSEFEEIRKGFTKNPNLFFRTILGVEPEPYQEAINLAIADNSRTAISACHDIGKSWDLARIVLWFGTCFPDSKIITTAPTFLQVKSILWSEINAAFSKSKYPLGGQMNMTEWRLSAEWFAIGLTPKKEAQGGEGQGTQSSFQGWHAPHILVIFDEATGIPPAIWKMVEGLLTSASVKFVAIGNPTSRNSEFFKCFSDIEWTKIKLNCFCSPNLLANGIKDLESLEREVDYVRSLSDEDAQAHLKSYQVVRPWLISTQWVIGRAIKWGLRHPLFLSKCLGEFPEEGDDTLIPLGICEAAAIREVTPLVTDKKLLGVDVARFGSDLSVLTYLHGHKFLGKKILVKRDTTQVAGEVIAMCNEFGWPDVITIDETGLGAGVVDVLREKQRERIIPAHVEIRGVQFGASPQCDRVRCDHKDAAMCEKAKYVNKKAQMFDKLGQDLRNGLSLPDEEVYLEELPTILYAFNSKGQMVIESKDDYKKRTGRSSPDHSDSLALANFGRYDENRVGIFTNQIEKDHSTFAGSLTSGDRW